MFVDSDVTTQALGFMHQVTEVSVYGIADDMLNRVLQSTILGLYRGAQAVTKNIWIKLRLAEVNTLGA